MKRQRKTIIVLEQGIVGEGKKRKRRKSKKET